MTSSPVLNNVGSSVYDIHAQSPQPACSSGYFDKRIWSWAKTSSSLSTKIYQSKECRLSGAIIAICRDSLRLLGQFKLPRESLKLSCFYGYIWLKELSPLVGPPGRHAIKISPNHPSESISKFVECHYPTIHIKWPFRSVKFASYKL